jgi:hypothetical protein
VVTVQMAGSSTFFGDPAAQAELLRQGIVVQETSLGSLQICSEPSLAQRYDVTNSGSQDAAACVVQELTKDGLDPHKSNPFSSPMVIITYDPIVALLEKIGVATQVGGLTIFNVRKYLSVVKSGMRWTDIAGNSAYPNQSLILLRTTDPRFSNSGGMFAAIAYAAQNNNDPVTDMRPGAPLLPVIRESFAEQGSMNTHTPDLLQEFLTEGMDAYPMAMIYESDYIYTRLQLGPKSGITAMYPDPDVISDNTLVSWTPKGNMLTTLLTSPAMAVFEERHGYRTSSDSDDFVSYMKAKGITVPSLDRFNPGLQFAGMPTEASLQALIADVVPG